MKKIVHIVLVLIFGISALGANTVNECKSDLYYANGIMMKYSEKDARDMWQDEADDLLLSHKEYKNIEKIDISYNVSQGFLDDFLEALEQMMDNEWGWTEFTVFFTAYLTDHGIQEDWVPHIKDLEKQVASYMESIKNGHGVIVIAHSQGNYYTNEAYERLDTWMQPSFHMMGVATPADHVAGYASGDTTAPYVKFHNDFINIIVTSLSANRDDTRHHGFPSIDAHDFYESYLQESTTRSDIQQFMVKQIEEHSKAPSQWSTHEELERGTCDYRITVKHRFDPSLEIGENVYPFAADQKLYPAKNQQSGETEYVKAGCGGTVFTYDWDEKQENECWMIDNPQKEKIVVDTDTVKFYVQYDYTDPDTVNIYGYGGYRAEEAYYTNSEFKIFGDCDKDRDDMTAAWNVVKNFSPEQNRFSFVDYAGVNHALECNLRGKGKSADDIEYIIMTSEETEIKHDDPSLIYPDYFETKVEYTAYLR